jgi:hypothetical protein
MKTFVFLMGMFLVVVPMKAMAGKCDQAKMEQLSEAINGSEQKMNKFSASILTGTDYGGYLDSYLMGSTLKKIVVWIGLSNKEIKTIYYFDQGKLFMVARLERLYCYNERLSRVVANMTNGYRLSKYYFSDMRIICSEDIINNEIKPQQGDGANLLGEADFYSKHVMKRTEEIDAENFLKGK